MKILLPTDFSEDARNATDYALHMFGKGEHQFHLMHTFSVPYMVQNQVISAYDKLKKETHQELVKEKVRIMKTFPKLDSDSVEIFTYMGSLFQVLDRLVFSLDLDLIVIGTKGASGLDGMLMGSNAATVVKQASCPVLAIPHGTKYKQAKRILFAADFKRIHMEYTLDLFLYTARKDDAHVLVLNVKTDKMMASQTEADERIRLQKILRGIPHTFYDIRNSYEAEDINEFAIKNKVDLVITIPRNHNLLDRLFKTSVTKKLVFLSEIPILALSDDTSP